MCYADIPTQLSKSFNVLFVNLLLLLDVVDTPRRHNDKQKTAEIVNSVLMKRRCQEEQAMTLDFSRQSKVCHKNKP